MGPVRGRPDDGLHPQNIYHMTPLATFPLLLKTGPTETRGGVGLAPFQGLRKEEKNLQHPQLDCPGGGW
jgi:hypothetical protein